MALPDIKPPNPRFWNKVHFEFEVGQRVIIRGSALEADVIGLCKDHCGEQYNIAWWYNGMRYTTWVFSRELHTKVMPPTAMK